MGRGEKHTDEPKERMTVLLPKEVKVRSRRHALASGQELSQIVRRALVRYLDSPDALLAEANRECDELRKRVAYAERQVCVKDEIIRRLHAEAKR